MPDPTFGVVLVNWNGADDTIAALESLLVAIPRPECVVVVDNGSAQASAERIEAWGETRAPTMHCSNENCFEDRVGRDWLTIIRASNNLGFSGGNNVGLKCVARRTELSHFLLLNNDATVAPDYFARMDEAIREFPDSALLGCAIYYDPERHKIWFAGGYEVPHRALVLHRYALPTSLDPQPTEFVTGCAMVISRALYQAHGGLAECYHPIYWEDGEYSFRARHDGWRVMLVPSARVYHKVGTSVGGEDITPQVAFWQNRHRGYYVRRNYRGVDRAIAIAYLVVTKPARALVECFRGRPAMGGAILRGFLHGLIDDTT